MTKRIIILASALALVFAVQGVYARSSWSRSSWSRARAVAHTATYRSTAARRGLNVTRAHCSHGMLIVWSCQWARPGRVFGPYHGGAQWWVYDWDGETTYDRLGFPLASQRCRVKTGWSARGGLWSYRKQCWAA